MKKQGVHGPKPSFLIGNITEMTSLVSAAVSQDMKTISHDIVRRILPHFVVWSNQYGMSLSTSSPTHAHNLSMSNFIGMKMKFQVFYTLNQR